MASTVLSSQPVLFNGACWYPCWKQAKGSQRGCATAFQETAAVLMCTAPTTETRIQSLEHGSLWSQHGASKTPLLMWCRLRQQIRNLKTGWFLSISVKNTMKGNTKKEESWRNRSLSSTHKSEVAQNWQGPTLFSKPPVTADWRWNNALEEGKSKQQHDFGHFTENLLRKGTQI